MIALNQKKNKYILMKKIIMRIGMAFLGLLANASILSAQTKPIQFGEERSLEHGKKSEISWINVNTAPETWRKEKDLLICSGKPIGVMRSEKLYENFILQVEWKHMEAGGNSGIFVWSDAKPGEQNRLPGGVEVQMLELDWVNQNLQNGTMAPIAYVHGELFG